MRPVIGTGKNRKLYVTDIKLYEPRESCKVGTCVDDHDLFRELDLRGGLVTAENGYHDASPLDLFADFEEK